MIKRVETPTEKKRKSNTICSNFLKLLSKDLIELKGVKSPTAQRVNSISDNEPHVSQEAEKNTGSSELTSIAAPVGPKGRSPVFITQQEQVDHIAAALEGENTVETEEITEIYPSAAPEDRSVVVVAQKKPGSGESTIESAYITFIERNDFINDISFWCMIGIKME